MDEKFEIVWQALVDNGSCKSNREAVKRYWDTLTKQQQESAHKHIPMKVKEGKFVQYDPIRAIRENCRSYQVSEPTNYNGRRLQAGTQYVIAKYKGSYGTYSLDEARNFGMEIKQNLAEPSPNHSRAIPEPLSRDNVFSI